jgi:hypothetical protein
MTLAEVFITVRHITFKLLSTLLANTISNAQAQPSSISSTHCLATRNPQPGVVYSEGMGLSSKCL